MERSFVVAGVMGVMAAFASAGAARADAPPSEAASARDTEPAPLEATPTDAAQPVAEAPRGSTTTRPVPAARSGQFHIAGGSGAAIGAVAPIVVACGAYLGNPGDVLTPLVALAAVPLTSALGAFIGLALEVGPERALAPAALAGASAPVGGLALGVAGAVVGGTVGLGLILLIARGIPTGDFGRAGLVLLAGGGAVVGGGAGVAIGTVGLPFALAATLPERLGGGEKE